MNQIGEISPIVPRNNKTPEIKIQIKKVDDKSEHSIISSEILNSSLEKDNQNLNLNTKENNINSENKNLLNIKQTSSKIINKRKQTESNTNANTKIIT